MVMFLSRISSALEKKRLVEIATDNGLILLNPDKIASIQSLELAEHLANRSISSGTNISKKIHLEFLLWLAGKKDISRALEEMLFEDNSDILVVSFRKNDSLMRLITKKKLELDLQKESSPAELERISLSRIN